MPKPTSMLQRWKLYCDATANRERPWLLPLLPVLAHAERYLASADGRLPGAGWSEVRGLRAPRRAYGVIRLREPTKHPHKFSGIFLHCYPQSSRRARPRAWTTTRSCSSRWSSVRSPASSCRSTWPSENIDIEQRDGCGCAEDALENCGAALSVSIRWGSSSCIPKAVRASRRATASSSADRIHIRVADS